MADINHKLMPKFFCLFWPKKFVAITLTSKLICYRTQKDLNDEPLRIHEEVHARQMRENGWLKFMIKYLWYSATVGYAKNPYETEAFKISGR